MTSLCALHERDKREQTRRQRIKRAGFGTAVLVVETVAIFGLVALYVEGDLLATPAPRAMQQTD